MVGASRLVNGLGEMKPLLAALMRVGKHESGEGWRPSDMERLTFTEIRRINDQHLMRLPGKHEAKRPQRIRSEFVSDLDERGVEI